MKKFIAASAALVSIALATPGFAQTSSSSSSTSSANSSVTASADLACMSAAIDARESAVISARAKLNASITAALTTRKEALKAAFTIGNNQNREVAVKAAWDAFLKATAAARAQYKTDVTAAWTVFVSASKNCNVNPDRGARLKRFEERKDNGKHNGWFKNAVKLSAHSDNDIRANVNAGANLDLSF